MNLSTHSASQAFVDSVTPPVAARYNQGKPDMSYLLGVRKGLEALVRVFEQGAVKYARGNWQKGGKPDTEYIGSAARHILLMEEEFYDSDIGTIHAANVIWNMLVYIQLNHADAPGVDPAFDQEAFEARYADKSAFN